MFGEQDGLLGGLDQSVNCPASPAVQGDSVTFSTVHTVLPPATAAVGVDGVMLTVADAFWGDVHIDPDPVPAAVNQMWNDLADQGLVRGVTKDVLPLACQHSPDVLCL